MPTSGGPHRVPSEGGQLRLPSKIRYANPRRPVCDLNKTQVIEPKIQENSMVLRPGTLFFQGMKTTIRKGLIVRYPVWLDHRGQEHNPLPPRKHKLPLVTQISQSSTGARTLPSNVTTKANTPQVPTRNTHETALHQRPTYAHLTHCWPQWSTRLHKEADEDWQLILFAMAVMLALSLVVTLCTRLALTLLQRQLHPHQPQSFEYTTVTLS